MSTIARRSGRFPQLSALVKPQIPPCCSTINHIALYDLTTLIKNRCLSGNLGLEEALGYFNSLVEIRPLPSLWNFNRLLGSVFKMTHYPIVLSMYKVLSRLADFRPKISTLNYVINCYCQLHRVDLGFSVLATVFKLGLEPNAHTLNILLHELCSRGSVVAALKLFEEMSEKEYPGHEYSYAIVINGLCKAGETWRAFVLLSKMCNARRVRPHAGCFCPVINNFFDAGFVELALGLFNVMSVLNVPPDVATCNSVIHGLCKFGLWEKGDKFRINMDSRHGISPNVRTYNILIDRLCKSGRISDAISLYNMMISKGILPNVVTFNSLVSVLCKHGRWDEVSELLRTMNGFGIFPDQATFAPMVDALCKEGRVIEALNLLEEMTHRGVLPNVVVYNSLIHGLCCSGQWWEGIELLDRMNGQAIEPCFITFSILVDALRKERREREAAIMLLGYMIDKDLVPDNGLRDVLICTFVKIGNI